jgi:glucose-6-phosphate isomerase
VSDPVSPLRFGTTVSDERQPAWSVAFAGERADAVVEPAHEQALAGLLASPPAWLDLDRALVDRELLRRVPVGPTLLLGIGGSALGARAALELAEVAGLQPGPLRILDTVDPWQVADALEWASACQAKLMVVSKSGTTLEVLALLEACLAQGLEVGTMIGDPLSATGSTPIRERLARVVGSEHCELAIPADVGGRWSVFTAVGQAPLRAANLDAHALVDAAKRELGRIQDPTQPDSRGPLLRTLAWRLANPAAHAVLWCYTEALVAWAAWQQQLECESLGRTRDDGSRTGELLCVLRGPADQHSVAQLLLDGPRHARISVVDFDDEPRLDSFGNLAELARLRMIERNACFASMTLPTRRVLIRDRGLATLGVMFLHGMMETALVAAAWGVDPYGQPAVETIKRAIRDRQS